MAALAKSLVGLLLLGLATGIGSPNRAESAELATPTAPANGVVYLDVSLGSTLREGEETRSPSLVRELIRQAFLIAARDELGLTTRDAWLGAQMPVADANAPFEMRFSAAEPNQLTVLRGFPARQAVVFSLPLPLDSRSPAPLDLPALIVTLEAASRESFVAGLEKSGFRRRTERPAPPGRAAPPAEAIEQRLVELNLFDQFQALRELHAAIDERGESSQLLSMLVRGYAQLGLLTELNWHPAHKVFKARALLYAQRLVRRYPALPSALEDRALAEALAGLHAAALASLAEADKLATVRPPGQSPAARSALGPILAAYARFDDDALQRLGENSDAGFLPALLRFVALEESGCDTLAIEYGLDAMQSLPDCPRLSEGISRMAGLGLGHSITEDGPREFASALQTRLVDMPDLPPAALVPVRSMIRMLNSGEAPDPDEGGLGVDWKLIARSIESLLDEGRVAPTAAAAPADAGQYSLDRAEMGWETLGLLLRETAWIQIWRRADFERNRLLQSPDPWIEATSTVVPAGACKAFLGTFAWKPDDRAAALGALAQLNPAGLEIEADVMAEAFAAGNGDQANRLRRLIDLAGDEVAPDLRHRLRRADSPAAIGRCARRLLAVSPYSPPARAALIRQAPDDFRDKIATWELGAERQPAVALALGEHYAQRGEQNEAEHFLRMAATMSHEQQDYIALADFYQRQGKEARWLETLEAFLEQPDYGVGHAQVRMRIYQRFVAKHDWTTAQVYAEGAAESYTSWGLECAAECNEALRDWERAEEYYSAVSSRFLGQEFGWFFFTRRTGEGRTDEAEAIAAKRAEELDDSPEADPAILATYYRLVGKRDQAMTNYRRAALAGDPYYQLHIALLADESGNAAERDASLAAVAEAKQSPESPGKRRPELALLAAAMRDNLARGGEAKFNPGDLLKRFDSPRGIDHAPNPDHAPNLEHTPNPEQAPSLQPAPERICDLYYFAGQYFEQRGQVDAAIDAWRACQACPSMQLESRTLAGAGLVRLGLTSDEFPNSFAPSAVAAPANGGIQP